MGARLDPKVAEAVMLKAGLKPLEPYMNSSTKWKCLHITCGEIVNPSLNTIRSGKGGCIKCGLKKLAASNRLPEKEAIALMISAGLEPLEPYIAVDKPWPSRCLICKKIVKPQLQSIKNGHGCIYCAGRKVDSNDVVAEMLKRGLKPLEEYKSSGSNWKCKCLKCGDLCSPSWDSIRSGQGGCKKCGYKKVGDSHRSDAAEAVTFMNKNGLEPLEPFRSMKKAWKCKCLKCGHLVAPHMQSIKSGHGACEYCSGTKVDPEEAKQFMLERNLKPLEPYKASRSKWKCECLRCGDIVFPLFNSIKNGQSGCLKCGTAQAADANRFSHEYAFGMMLEAGLEPLEPYSAYDKKWKCKCLKCGRTVTPTLHNVKGGHGGCAYCAEIGFDHEHPAYLYLIFHSEMDSIKVGIGNYDRKQDRIESFLKNGWELFKKFEFALGNDAYAVEFEVLRWLRKDKHLPPHLSLDQMRKTGGHSETVSADSITLLEIQRKIENAIKGLKK
jgi:hypothetical protein